MSSSKPRITISVDSPAKEVSVTVTVKETDAGEERLESMAGSSGDRLAVKAGRKNSKKVDKSEGYGKASQSGHEVAKSLDHEMSAARDHHDDGKELDGWEEVLGEESDPHPSSYSPPVVEPPSSASYATSSPSPAREGFGVGEMFVMTRKTGERLHRASCSLLKHHKDTQLVKRGLCDTCLREGIRGHDHLMAFSFEHNSCFHSYDSLCLSAIDVNRKLRLCKQCCYIP